MRFRLEPSSPDEVKARAAELLAQRKATQPTNKRTFGSVFKNPASEPGAGRMIEACGLKGHRIGGAMISPRHANFIENAGGATSSDCLAVMAEARRRVYEQFGVELEHEVQFLGPLELPRRPRRGRSRARRSERVAARRRTTARTAVAARAPRHVPSSAALAPVRALDRRRARARRSRSRCGYLGARDTSVFAVRTIDVRGGTATLRAQVRAALAAETAGAS